MGNKKKTKESRPSPNYWFIMHFPILLDIFALFCYNMGNSFKILKLNQIPSRTQINCKASNNEILKYLTPRFIPHIVGFEHNQNQAKWGIGSPRPFCASPFCRSFNHFLKLYKILIDK